MIPPHVTVGGWQNYHANQTFKVLGAERYRHPHLQTPEHRAAEQQEILERLAATHPYISRRPWLALRQERIFLVYLTKILQKDSGPMLLVSVTEKRCHSL
jgi:hypothetical protein